MNLLNLHLDKTIFDTLLSYAKPNSIFVAGKIGLAEMAVAFALQKAGLPITAEEIDKIGGNLPALFTALKEEIVLIEKASRD